ncbi:hypothetical protein Bbelb_324320 [Branchiostoma belcheri]|nr:hypothetical protein Bbelb_324320 [Branchiostoma belcheri]
MAPKFQQSLSCLSTTPLPCTHLPTAIFFGVYETNHFPLLSLDDKLPGRDPGYRLNGNCFQNSASFQEDSFQNTASFMEASKFPKYFHDVHVQIRPGRTPAPAILIAIRREEGVEYPLFTSDS